MSNKGNVVCCYLFIVLSKLQRPSSNILLDTKLTKILLLKSLLENAWFTFLNIRVFIIKKGPLTRSRYHAVFLLPWFLCCRSGYQSTNLQVSITLITRMQVLLNADISLFSCSSMWCMIATNKNSRIAIIASFSFCKITGTNHNLRTSHVLITNSISIYCF